MLIEIDSRAARLKRQLLAIVFHLYCRATKDSWRLHALSIHSMTECSNPPVLQALLKFLRSKTPGDSFCPQNPL